MFLEHLVIEAVEDRAHARNALRDRDGALRLLLIADRADQLDDPVGDDADIEFASCQGGVRRERLAQLRLGPCHVPPRGDPFTERAPARERDPRREPGRRADEQRPRRPAVS